MIHLPDFMLSRAEMSLSSRCGPKVAASVRHLDHWVRQRRLRYLVTRQAKAIHECNITAAKYKQYTWGVTEITTYRTCMAEHGQQE
jgi:hypothetical protein